MAGPGGRLDVVVICGGRWHDFDYARLELLTRLGAFEQVRTRVFEDYATLPSLDAVDLLITYTCDVRPDEMAGKALAGFVSDGGRWLALHGTNSAIDAPPSGGPKRYETPRVLGVVAEVLGSQFLAHPPIEPYRVEVTQPGHPLVAGITPFEVSDELYICELHGEREVLLHTRFKGSCPGFAEGEIDDDDIRPVLYLHPWGQGQVLYFTLGHCRGRFDVQDLGVDDTGKIDRGSWTVPEYNILLDRAIRWGLEGSTPS